MLGLILLVFSFGCGILATFIAPVTAGPLGRVHFGWLAFTFLVASILFGGGKLLGVH